jgi:putative colanic acid biosynthesis UDP-glucose lipid carrier transferase
MNNNNQANSLIKWSIIVLDFVILNALIFAFLKWHPKMLAWSEYNVVIFVLTCNLAMMISESYYHTVIHRRLIGGGEILRRLVWLTLMQTVLAYLFTKMAIYNLSVGWILLMQGTVLFVCLLIARFVERYLVRMKRKSGKNIRKVVLVGSDSELLNIYDRLMKDPTRGYKVLGYYGDETLEGAEEKFKKLGTIDELLAIGHDPVIQARFDDMYVSLSRLKSELIKKLSVFCEENVIRFYFVPVSVESIGIPLRREQIDDIEVYTTYTNPLQIPANKAMKRAFDLVFSTIALICILPFLPIIALIIKIQSPKGGVFFKQPRTGIDGKSFMCYKFRSMHPNKDESGLVQAKKDDPRKFPFGNFMRKASIDELPQFWNVFKGDMSIIGPRPHPVALNEEYVKLIDKYMVRHYVKPGVTGWAQVTGFRGETEELWQMEGRVKRDIWYMEHWTIWLDIRIIWLTVRQILLKDKQAY